MDRRTDLPGFQELFGREPTVAAEAPGRVNLIGEHTDYNGGYVLPIAIPLRTRVEIGTRIGTLVRVWSANAREPKIEEYRLEDEAPGRGWLDYVQGATQVLRLAGHRLRGFDLRIESDIPLGGGLSSSASLEVAVLRGLREAFSLEIDDVDLALAGQKAENDFVGAPVGIMDLLAASLAGDGKALFLDTRTLRFDRVPLPAAAELVVIDSGVSHRHADGADGGYRLRQQECEQAAELLGFKQLRDLDNQDLWRLAALPEPLDRRARHVITENARVRAAVAAMRDGDLERLGKLLILSHQSLRDDFEVSIPEIDLLVELAQAQRDVYGARITGGGFGGSIVAVARAGTGRQVGEKIAKAYAKQTRGKATVLVPAGEKT
jgi:galactokinase